MCSLSCASALICLCCSKDCCTSYEACPVAWSQPHFKHMHQISPAFRGQPALSPGSPLALSALGPGIVATGLNKPTAAHVVTILHLACRWFRAQGVPVPMTDPAAAVRQGSLLQAKRQLQLSPQPAAKLPAHAGHQQEAGAEHSATLLLCDFDKTLTDCDAGERTC